MSIKSWFSESFPVDSEALIKISSEPIPNHLKRWWWGLGGTPLFMFIIQVVTGMMLIFYYIPDPDKAYQSVDYITHTAKFGWLIRSIHRWASNIMIAALLLHMLRVFFTQTFRKPRELNWMFGVTLLLLTLMFGFTGYSLVYEQMSYWAMSVGTGIAGATPFIGNWLADFIRGGSEIGQNTLTRFFLFHIALIPLITMIVIGIHIYLIRALGVSELKFPGDEKLKKKSYPLFPDHVFTELIIVTIILIILVTLSLLFPAGLGEPANPNVTPLHIKPEWYFYPVFRWLKVTNLELGIIGPLIFILILYIWPFIDRFFEKSFPGKEIAFWIGVAGFFTINIFLFWEIFGH
ncbi:MAG: cytochrome bc complex cytochrome b subunit [Bacteroidales bacterium]|nr:cytochrome bc complex cytochrome b subunit [Bacteroidales bacterium]